LLRPLVLAGGDERIKILEVLLVFGRGHIAPAGVGWEFLSEREGGVGSAEHKHCDGRHEMHRSVPPTGTRPP
jgi:hypothetical protein